MTFGKYLVILSIVFFGSIGDAFLARGMKHAGAIDVHHLSNVFVVLANPYVIVGILFLLGFMWSYMTALSFADLSYVLPATAISYIVMVLLSIFWLHEHVSRQRWSGVAFIVTGVGMVAGGPERTEFPPAPVSDPPAVEEQA
ncbi:MAG TPA: EamA family transporter [Candidatus Acidoferrales bacterium]|nr:EamA family transporter [Candidatus Acidoferrales bacterium]